MKVYAPGEKRHTQENFPVASYIISKKHRGAVLAFYRFARAADDVADHPKLSEQEKITQLDQFEATLLGTTDTVADALPLRDILASRKLSPRHALDLLIAFRQDARQQRYRNWDELMQYCAYSAAPVGRFVLDVHGENLSTWPASDALCSVLQIINHLQDCKTDYQRLNRVYIPQDSLALHKTPEVDLALEKSSQGLRDCLRDLAHKTQSLLSPVPLSGQVRDMRLRIEVATIEGLAHKLLTLLQTRDPLSERVHLGKMQLIAIMAQSISSVILGAKRPGMDPRMLWAEDDGEQAARGSSFYTAMRIMPPRERAAMYEIYRFCRAVDDIADDEQGDTAQRLGQLNQWRNGIEALYCGTPPQGVKGLAEAIQHFALHKPDFLAVIDGMEMDVRGPIQSPDMVTLELYCDRVACAVGRLSVRVFGLDEEDGVQLAHHLGMALQLTNILRDIDEDCALGRLYLPRELLDAAKINGSTSAEIIAHSAITQVCMALADKAMAHFQSSDRIMKPYPHKIVRTPRVMSQAYRSILNALIQRGFTSPRARVRLSKAKLGVILLRNML